MVWILALTMVLSGSDFDSSFTGQTMRLDYVHTGTAKEEHIALDAIHLEKAWAGTRSQCIDLSNTGKYMFEIVSMKTNGILFSQGFSSIYGEWETTGEAAKGTWRAFHESARFPEPRQPFQFILKKRQNDGSFSQIYSTVIDPKSRFVDRSEIAPVGSIWTVWENGPASEKVDLLILSEGYTAKEKDKFRKDVKRLTDRMFSTEPFKSRRKDFNVRAIELANPASGISNPRKGIWRKTMLGLSFNSFDSDRYVLTYDNKEIREIAAQVPYDAIIMVANDTKYGGGGIYNLWATVTADAGPAGYVFVHEFGHSFAGLADEYYSSPVSYEDFTPPGSEPWEPNVTALLNPGDLKWKHLMERETPLPTPWNKEAYDTWDRESQQKRAQMIKSLASDSAMEALYADVKITSSAMLHKEKFYGKVGAFEGAAYEAIGLYRPEIDCIMFTRNDVPFCKVCLEAINKTIDRFVK